jgi:hypothetical protein
MNPARNGRTARPQHTGVVLLASLCLVIVTLICPRPLLAQEPNVYLPLLSDGPAQPVVNALITPAEGGTASYDGGRLELVVGPEAVSEPVRVTLRGVQRTPPSGMVSAGLTVEISFATLQGKPVTHLDGIALVRVSTLGVDPTQVTPQTVDFYHEETSGKWVPLIDHQQIDPDMIEVWVSDFSAFGLFGESTLRSVRGIAAAENGTVYWFNEEDAAIYGRSPDGTWFKHHQLEVPPFLLFNFQRGNNLVFERATGAFYVVADNCLRKITTDGNEVLLYEVTSSSNEVLSGATMDPSTGALYLATQNNITQRDPNNGTALGKVIPAPSGHIFSSIAADGQGRLYALAYDYARSGGRLTASIDEWYNLFVIDLAVETPRAQAVAAGFIAARGLVVDGEGTVYVSNEDADVISVLSGSPLVPAGRIKTGAPWGLALSTDGASLWTAPYAGGAFSNIAATRRDAAQAMEPKILDSDGSVSGRGSTVTVQLAAMDPVPAHHTLLLGDTPVADVCGIETEAGRLVYCLPDIWDTFPTNRPDVWPEFPLQGKYRLVAAGLLPVDGGTPVFPDSSNFERWAPPDALVRDDWLVWSGDDLAKVHSANGLFADWTPELGHWLAVQLPKTGTFDFEVTDTAGNKVQRSVTVLTESPVRLDNSWIVQPAKGATLRNAGAVITIPPGALPGTEPYTVGLDIWLTEPAYNLGTYTGFSNQYGVRFHPEPARLNNQVTIRLPIGSAALGSSPVGSIYDTSLQDYTPIQYQLGAGYVEIILPAGAYSPPEDGAAAVEESTQAALSAEDAPGAPTGETPHNAVNTVTKGLWWITGLANAQWESEHFIVRYHGDEGTSSYSSTLIQALETAYDTFEANGFTMPSGKTIARVTPSIPDDIDGFAPTIGTLGHWYMYFNDGAGDDRLKATAAHEFFHVIQQSTMSAGGRATAPTWWIEATAIWAEKLVFGNQGVTEYREKIRTGCSFANVGLYEYGNSSYFGGLDEEQQYGAAALVIYLEDQHGGAVANIFKNMGLLTTVYDALESEVGDMSQFYQEFAIAYWGQRYADAEEWDLGACVDIHYIDQASNVVVDVTGMSPLSSRAVKAYVQPGHSITGVDGTSGSVLRMALAGARAAVFVLERAAPPLEPIKDLAPFNATEDNEGRYLELKLDEYTINNPYTFIAMNRVTAGSSERMKVVLEAPIIGSCSPSNVHRNVETTVGLSGAGFGPVPGSITPGDVTSWQENSASTLFTPESAGSVGIRLRHANGAFSNVCTIKVE